MPISSISPTLLRGSARREAVSPGIGAMGLPQPRSLHGPHGQRRHRAAILSYGIASPHTPAGLAWASRAVAVAPGRTKIGPLQGPKCCKQERSERLSSGLLCDRSAELERPVFFAAARHQSDNGAKERHGCDFLGHGDPHHCHRALSITSPRGCPQHTIDAKCYFVCAPVHRGHGALSAGAEGIAAGSLTSDAFSWPSRGALKAAAAKAGFRNLQLIEPFVANGARRRFGASGPRFCAGPVSPGVAALAQDSGDLLCPGMPER
jgi:hypothetical protein